MISALGENWRHQVMSRYSFTTASVPEEKLVLLARLFEEEGIPPAPVMACIRRDSEFLLSSAQMRLWLFDQLEPGSPAYNIVVRYDLTGHLEVAALELSLNEIVRRHEVLRTSYLKVDGRPVQKIGVPEPLRIPVVDLQGLPEVAQEEETARVIALDAARPFDLGKPPLVRALLFRWELGKHVLMLNVHHIAFDWWSLGVFEQELVRFYNGSVRGEASPLPELPVQYVDFAAWQQELLQSDVLGPQLDYWKGRLSGALPVLELPTDRPRPPVQTYKGSSVSAVFSDRLTESLKILSHREGVTLFVTLLAAFKVLLHRYTGQDDMLVGAPIANRNRPETEGLIGFFVNTLVMRTDLSCDPTFRELLRRVQDTAVGAYANQDLPFEKLVEVLNPHRDTSRSPLFQVMLSMLNTPAQPLALHGLQHSRAWIDSGTSRFDLTLYVLEEAGGLTCTFEYNTDLFNADRIDRMFGHLQVLLESVIADPSQRLSELPLLTSEERHRLLTEWNDTRADYPQDILLQQLFEAQVERTPDAVAVEFDGKQLSYRQLNQRANRLAHHLRMLGVSPDTFVGVCMERSLELVVALCGILKAGGAYVPIDPDYPQDRVGFILEDAGLSVMLTQHRLAGQLINRDAICVDDDEWQWVAGDDVVNPPTIGTPDSFAYMIYTSGSTGKPKGAMNTHRGICNRLLWMQSQYGLTEADRILQKTPASFDVSVWEFFWPLLTGARLVLAKPGGHKDPGYLIKLITEQQITVAHFVPSMLAAFLSEPGVEGCSSLRHVICSGEALPFNLQEQFFKLLPAELHNLYGPTEAAVDVTHWTCRLDDQRRIVPIGRPIANTQVYILDKHLQPVPIGVSGELCIGGVQVCVGYHNRPHLTAERFVPNPFNSSRYTRMYKTGDLCRWLSDGNIEYLGRSDFQVKIRGFRVELGEVEAVLARHEAVNQCVVVAREDAPGDKLLVAYFEPRGGQAPAVTELRTHLKTELPEYMVPSAFVALERLPLTPNGKIDRKALPPPTYDKVQVAGGFVGPRTEAEKALAVIWAEVLKVGLIGINDDFFDLGGHSLLVIKAVSRIRDVFDVELPPMTFFANSTIAALARVLADAKSNGGGIARIEQRSQSGPLPLSFAQERLWFLDQLAPGNPVYNIVDVVGFDGEYHPEAMRRAVNEIVRRHESLRTVFSSRDGQPVQIVLPAVDMVLGELNLRELPEQDRDREWIRVVREEGRKPFKLTQPPLLRGTVVQRSGSEHSLLVVIHHIIADEWSMEVFHQELRQLYRAFSQGEPSPLRELPIQYTDFSSWQRGRLQGEVLQKQISFWKQELAGAPAILELSTDKPRPAVQSFRGATEAFELSKELLDRLKALSRQEQATLFMTLGAGFTALLHRYTGQRDIVVGTPISGRTRSEMEGLIGLFLNTVVLRAQFAGDVSFRALLRQVRERALGAYGHQDLPLDQLVAELAPQRDPSRTPLFQVMFILFNADTASQTSDAASLSQTANGTSKFDLTLAISETGSGLRGVVEYSTDLFEADTIRRLCGHYETLLEAITQDPDQNISMLPILRRAERRQLLVDWNDTRVDYPQDILLQQLFEAQVERTPDAVAVEFAGKRLSYGELNRRANQLAHHLRGLGAGPDVLMGLCVERSLEMAIAVLGILKAGGAYVPLDPSFPQERLAYMVEDSGMRVLVTHRELDAGLPVRPAAVVYLDSDEDKIAQQSTADPKLQESSPADLAYVLYTSGSTGKPKGVEIAHSALVNFLLSMRREPGFTSADTLLAVTTLSFDIAGLELYLPLISGGKVVIASREETYDPARLVERIRESHCTVMQATPATWRALIDAGWGGSRDLKLLCGGESLPPDLAQALLGRCGELWNMYGPTETTIWSAIHKVTGADDGSLPIGWPIANTQIFVLDANRNAVPRGVAGELYIGGAGLARGYLRRPMLTRERFIQSPFEPNQRLYRTGDLARWLPEGTLECLGRVDNQVKIRGFRVELGEVEAVLARHKAVNQCVVVAREDAPGDKLLVAYFEPRGGQAPAVTELRAHLKTELPEYMVPSAFVALERLPLTPNGKIDRKALPPPIGWGVEVHRGGFVAPRDPLEQMLARMWAKVLKASPIGLYDNFFDLGGHSLSAVRIVAEIEKLFKTRLPLATFLRAPTVGDLAGVLRKQNWKPFWSSLVPIRAGGSKPPLFLMHSHRGNVLEYYPLANRMEADQPVYALQARGLDGEIVKDQSLGDMADAYLAELRSLQPEGPYYLGGYCFGGLLAIEAARRLSALGAEVALVVLIQTINPMYARFKPNLSVFQRSWYRTTKRVDLELEQLHYKGAGHVVDRCKRAWQIATAKTAVTVDHWTKNGHRRPQDMSMSYALEMLAIEHDKARRHYIPHPYSGDVILFRASKQLSGLMTDSSLGWKGLLAGNLEIHDLPGHQETLLSEPNVSLLAQELTIQLRTARVSGPLPVQVRAEEDFVTSL